MAIKIKAGWEEHKFWGLAGGELIPGKPLKDLAATQLQAIMDGDPTNASTMLDGEVSAVPPVVDNAPGKPLPTVPRRTTTTETSSE